MAAPCYTDSGYSAPTSPPYSASVTDGERIVELRPSLSSLPNDLPDHYMFQSQRIKLDLGARIWPTRTPCFGRTGVIEGTVSVTTLDHIKRLTIMVEAIVKSSFMERGILIGHIESTLFQRSVTPIQALLQPTNLLPPSFICYLPGVSAEVRYRIRVDMPRSGLRRRESLTVPILYLPRSYAPLTPRAIPLFDDQVHLSDAQGMKELHLAPKPIGSSKKSSKPQALTTAEVQAKLVKVTRIKAYEKISLKELVLAAGEVYESEERGDGVQILRGELGNGTPGTELSWSAGEAVEVKV
ncbi:hypothetical protein RHS01_03475 [Rhizoctonia solani]|uniref:Uncharacterized protein n=1 Tax=Rhizoctonia solani TaxID=456999 RepID=A0A8H7M8A8_9AGAM|nr:hypothetical protein RHS01_03475 [Rhizoctonia solani]